MSSDYNIKQITKLYESCKSCGVPIINCICENIEQIETQAKIWILSSQNEVRRASNTARLLKLANNKSVKIFIWERTKEPKELVEKINSDKYDVYLLFPSTEETKEREVIYKKSNKIPAFIIVDGTWQEAKKIVRKSPYLNNIQILSLKPNNNSKFSLRRGIEEGNLCTIETAIEVFKINNENREALKLEGMFKVFQEAYKCGLSGHKIKVK